MDGVPREMDEGQPCILSAPGRATGGESGFSQRRRDAEKFEKQTADDGREDAKARREKRKRAKNRN
jgi:hypothetical protein